MDKQLKKLSQDLKNICLHRDEKSAVRENILQYLEQNPVNHLEKESMQQFAAWRSLFTFFSRKPIAALMVLVLVFTSAGISYASNSALPGDFLYPVKFNINEEIIASFKFSKEEKVDWEIKRSEKRINEAKKLKEKNLFDEEKKNFLADKLGNHLSKIDKIKSALKKDIASNVENQYSQKLKNDQDLVLEIFLPPATYAEVSHPVAETQSIHPPQGADPPGGVTNPAVEGADPTGGLVAPESELSDQALELESFSAKSMATKPALQAINEIDLVKLVRSHYEKKPFEIPSKEKDLKKEEEKKIEEKNDVKKPKSKILNTTVNHAAPKKNSSQVNNSPQNSSNQNNNNNSGNSSNSNPPVPPLPQITPYTFPPYTGPIKN